MATRVRMPVRLKGQGQAFRGIDSLLARMHVQEVARSHKKLLAKHRHLRYMWIPYTDAVVVVTNDQVAEVHASTSTRQPAQASLQRGLVCIQAGSFAGVSMLGCRDLRFFLICTELEDLGITLTENHASNRARSHPSRRSTGARTSVARRCARC